MPWLQLKIDTQRESAETLEDALLAAGAVTVTLQDNADQPILEPALGETPLWDNTRITGLFDAATDTALATATAEDVLGQTLPTHRWELLEDRDWEREWMNNYHPIRCGEKLWICPSWLAPPEPDAVNLMLDPGLAFGTGTHPTTHLCLQWLDQQDVKNATVLDYGCGSGILGIAALLLGANSMLGTDIDPQALIATKDNAERNGIRADQYEVFLPPQLPDTQAEIVLANILAGPLVELAPVLIEHLAPGGRLCLSGVLQIQAEEIQKAYSQWITFDPVHHQEEWICLTGIKR